MATRQLASPRVPIPRRPATTDLSASRIWANLPLGIAVVLLVTIVYGAFAHGAVTRASATRVELVVAGLGIVTALGWIWLGTIRLGAPRTTLAGVLLLVAFAAWSGLSVIWSISPDQTWIEVNRVLTYALVVALGVAVGASHTRALELIAKGFVLAALAVTVYALGQKLLPGLHVSGVFDLNQTGPLPRLQEPLGYWNALALFIAMGAPTALALTVDQQRSAAGRLATACALSLMLITVPLTYSRGGLIGLAVALAVGAGLSRERLRSLVWLIAALLTALPAILVGLLMHALGEANVPLGSREGAGGVLAVAVLAGLGVLVLAGRRLLRAEPRLEVSATRARTLRRATLAGAAALVVAGLLALALSPRGFTGSISQAWHGFTTTHNTSNYDPQRLLSAASENRWVWWKEAAAAFSARPWNGWGAGSFPVLHLLYRRDTLPVQQPHSVPLQFLAETGVIGAALGIGAFLLLAAGGLRAVRERPPGSERLLAAGLLGAAAAYSLHCLYDWDWNIPALSLPAFLFLGVVAGRRSGPAGLSWGATDVAGAGRPGSAVARGLALAGATLCLFMFALSVELPQLAADRATAALLAASGSSPGQLRAAEAEASLATRLDPLSDAGLLSQATVAVHLSRPQSARAYLREAVTRDPSDPEAWRLLGEVDSGMGDRAEAYQAFQRAISLDPMGRFAQEAEVGLLHRAPPSSSATRFPTPPPGG